METQNQIRQIMEIHSPTISEIGINSLENLETLQSYLDSKNIGANMYGENVRNMIYDCLDTAISLVRARINRIWEQPTLAESGEDRVDKIKNYEFLYRDLMTILVNYRSNHK